MLGPNYNGSRFMIFDIQSPQFLAEFFFQHIEAWARRPPFRRLHFQMHLLERKYLCFDQNFTDMCSCLPGKSEPHDDVIKWKHFPRYWQFVRGIHRSPVNYVNPVYDVATICHQVRWLRWGHPNIFHTATSILIWYKMFCVRDISYRLIRMEFINMFSVYAHSGTHSRFNW